MIAHDRRPYFKTRQDVHFQFFGSPTALHATGETTDGRFCLLEAVTMPAGLASPYHTHHNEDEAFYVLDGHVRVVCDGTWLDANASASTRLRKEEASSAPWPPTTTCWSHVSRRI